MGVESKVKVLLSFDLQLCSPGLPIIRQGETSEGFIWLYSGKAAVFWEKSDFDVDVEEVSQGNMLGDLLSLFGRGPSLTTCRATFISEIMVLRKDMFDDYCRTCPKFREQVIRAGYKHLEKLQRTMTLDTQDERSKSGGVNRSDSLTPSKMTKKQAGHLWGSVAKANKTKQNTDTHTPMVVAKITDFLEDNCRFADESSSRRSLGGFSPTGSNKGRRTRRPARLLTKKVAVQDLSSLDM